VEESRGVVESVEEEESQLELDLEEEEPRMGEGNMKEGCRT